MKSAVDTNVLLDVLLPDPKFLSHSQAALEKQFSAGALLIGDVVYAELASQFADRDMLNTVLGKLHLDYAAPNPDSCYLAGRMFHEYCKRGGKRNRVLADFLVGAHAQTQADCLISRDRGFYKSYFRTLKIIEP